MTTNHVDMWHELEEAGDVVVQHQARIAIYQNSHGHVVIRQEGHLHPDEDVWVVVAPEHAARVAEAILEVAGQASEQLALPAPDRQLRVKDRTAAERQRRYRQRKDRNGASVTDVGLEANSGDGAG